MYPLLLYSSAKTSNAESARSSAPKKPVLVDLWKGWIVTTGSRYGLLSFAVCKPVHTLFERNLVVFQIFWFRIYVWMIFAFSLLYPQNSRCTRSSCSRICISSLPVRDLWLDFALTCFRKVWSTHVRRILTRRYLSALISLYSFFNPPFRTVCKWPHTGPSKLKYHMILTPIAGVHLCFPLLLILCKLSCPIMMQLSNLLDCNIGILFAKAFWFTSGRTGDFYAEINQNHALNAWYTQAL